MITTLKIQIAIRHIKKDAEDGDWEAAHTKEDKLFKEVMRAIAEGDYPTSTNPHKIATETLKSLELIFPRECG